MKYYLRYHTGAGEELVEVDSLDDAKKLADKGASYTQMDISIEDTLWNTICTRRWYGLAFDSSLYVVKDPICFGKFGFYGDWCDVRSENFASPISIAKNHFEYQGTAYILSTALIPSVSSYPDRYQTIIYKEADVLIDEVYEESHENRRTAVEKHVDLWIRIDAGKYELINGSFVFN